MKKLYYPIILTKNKKNYLVEYVDFKNIVTQGEDLEEAFHMAKDALFGMLDYIENMPEPTLNFSEIKLKKNQLITLIELDVEEFAKKVSKKIVNTTVTMPEWLKISAEIKGINFSQVLQNEIKKILENEYKK